MHVLQCDIKVHKAFLFIKYAHRDILAGTAQRYVDILTTEGSAKTNANVKKDSVTSQRDVIL